MILRVGDGVGCWRKGPLTTAAGAVGFRLGAPSAFVGWLGLAGNWILLP